MHECQLGLLNGSFENWKFVAGVILTLHISFAIPVVVFCVMEQVTLHRFIDSNADNQTCSTNY